MIKLWPWCFLSDCGSQNVNHTSGRVWFLCCVCCCSHPPCLLSELVFSLCFSLARLILAAVSIVSLLILCMLSRVDLMTLCEEQLCACTLGPQSSRACAVGSHCSGEDEQTAVGSRSHRGRVRSTWPFPGEPEGLCPNTVASSRVHRALTAWAASSAKWWGSFLLLYVSIYIWFASWPTELRIPFGPLQQFVWLDLVHWVQKMVRNICAVYCERQRFCLKADIEIWKWPSVLETSILGMWLLAEFLLHVKLEIFSVRLEKGFHSLVINGIFIMFIPHTPA